MALGSRSVLCLALAAALIAAPAARGAAAVAELLEAHGLGGAEASVVALRLDSGERLLAERPGAPRIPASNMKLLTTAAALAELGPDFRFRTELRIARRGERPPVLIVRGSGDPAFGDRKILDMHGLSLDGLIGKWVDAVRSAGVERAARLVVDDRIFDRTFVHPDWPRDQLNRWYCAQVAGLNFHDNCLDVYPAATEGGEPARIRIEPPVDFVETANKTRTAGKSTFWISRELGTNAITFRGKVQGEHRRPTHVTIHDPPRFFARFLGKRLERAGVSVAVTGKPGPAETLPEGEALHAVETTLKIVLQRCNKDSQNLFAEALLKRLGRARGGDRGSWENGAAAVSGFLRRRLGAEAAAEATVADGSGMSRHNRVSARVLARLLRSMHRENRLAAPFRHSLAVGGKDGTLENRLQGPLLEGRVFAKSGYISGVSALSGYLFEHADPHEPGAGIAFAFLFNDVPAGRVGKAKALQAKLLRRLAGRLP